MKYKFAPGQEKFGIEQRHQFCIEAGPPQISNSAKEQR
jgi:hypothetical protein